MARIRTIKPAFFSSLSNAELPKPTRLTWIGLWTYVDDAGRAVDDPRLVKAAIWPLDDDYTTKKVDADLDLLAKVGKIERYVIDGRRYLRVVEWHHQRINRPVPSTLPVSPNEVSTHNKPPPDDSPPHDASSEDSVSEHGANSEDSPPEGNGREWSRKGVGRDGKLNSSSSNHLSVSRPAPDDDDEVSPTQRALALIADRRIAAAEAAGAVIQNPGSYRRTVLKGVNAEFGDEAEKLLLEGMSVEIVADMLVPAKSEAARRYPSFDSNAGPVWDEVEDEQGHLVVVPRTVSA